jgi:transformer-2 protein
MNEEGMETKQDYEDVRGLSPEDGVSLRNLESHDKDILDKQKPMKTDLTNKSRGRLYRSRSRDGSYSDLSGDDDRRRRDRRRDSSYKYKEGHYSSRYRDDRDKVRFHQGRSSERSPAENPGTVLYVGQLYFKVSDKSLEELFKPYGKVLSSVIQRDRQTNDSLRYGFVTMESSKDAEVAIKALNGSTPEGFAVKPLIVELAKRSHGHEATPGTYRGHRTSGASSRYPRPSFHRPMPMHRDLVYRGRYGEPYYRDDYRIYPELYSRRQHDYDFRRADMALDRNRRDPVDRRRFDGRPVVLPGRHSHYDMLRGDFPPDRSYMRDRERRGFYEDRYLKHDGPPRDYYYDDMRLSNPHSLGRIPPPLPQRRYDTSERRRA